MESVFITILDLSPDGRIKFCSDSIEDILGYSAHEVKGNSCWDFFHRDEVVFAKAIHGRGVDLDKAAVLNYCRIKHKDGSWIGCECVFTIVHDVLVASVSIYKRGPKARRRAIEGAGVRRIFSSSPRDPRYHMLEYLSGKFYKEPLPHAREPRAALFLNRFTRTSPVMFATGGVSQILGLEPDQLIGKSFYYCIAETCLGEAVKCLESAKSNDSIAYLRFWYRNPLQSASRAHSVIMDDAESDEDDDGGVRIRESSQSSVEMRDSVTPQPGGVSLTQMNGSVSTPPVNGISNESAIIDSTPSGTPAGSRSTSNGVQSHSRSFSDRIANEPPVLRNRMADLDRVMEERVAHRLQPPSRESHHYSSSGNSTDRDTIFDPPELRRDSSNSSVGPDTDIEVEAVISCTSDGLVVVLRRAHPLNAETLAAMDTPYYANGLFAAPWATQSFMPSQGAQTKPVQPTENGFMAAIRDVAVFAWSLTGINGSLADHGVGEPTGESVPPGGLPIWDPSDPDGQKNDAYNGFSGSIHRPLQHMGDPAHLPSEDPSSSEDEIVWKREPTMSAWRRPKRRAHVDAFGDDGTDGTDGQGSDGSRKRALKAMRN